MIETTKDTAAAEAQPNRCEGSLIKSRKVVNAVEMNKTEYSIPRKVDKVDKNKDKNKSLRFR